MCGEQNATTKTICVTCCIAVVGVVALFVALLVSSIHYIDEGKVGVYYKNGALQEGTNGPGVHTMAPFVSKVVQLVTRTETDTLPDIECVTRDGIQNNFRGIQVMSKINETSLIYMMRKFGLKFKEMLVNDRISEELRTFCAGRDIDQVYNSEFLEIVAEVKKRVLESITRLAKDGILIYNLVIPKPDIPNDIAANYKQVKVQWTEQLVAQQKQKTAVIHKETEAMRAIEDAEREKEVLKINIQKDLLEKEGQKNISELNNEILKGQEEAKANNEYYRISKQAEANKKLYTDGYVKLNLAKSLSQNTKVYFSGENSVLGKVLQQILANQN